MISGIKDAEMTTVPEKPFTADHVILFLWILAKVKLFVILRNAIARPISWSPPHRVNPVPEAKRRLVKKNF